MPFGHDVLLRNRLLPGKWLRISSEYFTYIDVGCGYCQFDIIQNCVNIM